MREGTRAGSVPGMEGSGAGVPGPVECGPARNASPQSASDTPRRSAPDGRWRGRAGRAARGRVPRGRVLDGRVARGRVLHGRVVARGRARGPSPAGPATVPVPVRPTRPERPGGAVAPVRSDLRLLARRPVPARAQWVLTVRRAAAGIAVAVVTAAVVVVLGLLAGMAGSARTGEAVPVPSRSVSITVGEQETVHDVARVLAPDATEAQLSVVAERLVAANSLTSPRVRPGQVLRVTPG